MKRVERWGRRAVAVCGMALCGLMLTACQLNGHVQVGADRSVTVDLLANDQQTFVCHKTLDKERMMCAGAH